MRRSGDRGIALAMTPAHCCRVDMIRDAIRELLDRDPFVPFRVVLSSGKHYDVVNPQTTVLLKSEVFIAFPDGERWSIVSLLHIASIETVTNDRGRRSPRRKRE